MTSLTQAFQGLHLVEPRREESPSHFGIAQKSLSRIQGNVYACVKEMGVVATSILTVENVVVNRCLFE